MIVVTDLLRLPFDEGAKNTAYNIISSFDPITLHKIISINGNEKLGVDVEVYNVNKTLINIHFLVSLRALPGSEVLYIPESSATVFSIIRSKLLTVFTGKNVYILALQPRKYLGLKRYLVKLIAPKMIMTPSRSYESYLREEGLNSVSIPLGVNNEVYKEYSSQEEFELRCKYDIRADKIVLLHVGHVCKSRNLEWLIEVKNRRPNIEVVIVGSTYNESDLELHGELENQGIIIINQYIESMAEIYNLANYCVFPVLDDHGAIATPLSVLEAMSCNVPIITTRFGSLVDMFKADKDFYFIDNSAAILRVLNEKNDNLSACTNRAKIGLYTWGSIAKKIEKIVGH